jgi:hypothetical protein
MNNSKSNYRSKVLSGPIALSRALRAVKKIRAAVKARHLALAAIVAVVSSVAVAAVLTGSSGVSGVVYARASFADSTDIKFKIKGQNQEVIQVNNAQETVIQQIVVAPGGNTGWHSHPGPAVVKSASAFR